jgi:tRNA-specific 2-thiouridylase
MKPEFWEGEEGERMNTEAEMKRGTRVAVAMSGGIDSSVAAGVLVDLGFDVIGLTAHMWKDGSRCCSIEDVERARKVAWFLGIKHYVLNACEVFEKEVVNPFVDDYLHGRTPSPCVICNKKVKFGFLLTRAVEFDCSALATGHYAGVERRNGDYHLLKAKDRDKDQSYFLHRLSQRQLAHTLFPLSDVMKKGDTMAYVEKKSLPVEQRKESQDLCFVPDGHHEVFVEKRCDRLLKRGVLKDADGRELGTHGGIHKYTVGQRRGLKISSPVPLYVTRIDAEQNAIEVGPRDQVMKQECRLEDVSWISGGCPDDGGRYRVRIRYNHQEAPATLEFSSDGGVGVRFEEPQFAITPGQAGVIYDGDEVLGGGWIGGKAEG